MALKREGGEMPSLEERVAYLEGRLEDHTEVVNDLRSEFGKVRSEVHDLREDMGRRFESVDRRFEDVGRRFDALDQKVDRRFTWLVGIQVAVLVAVVSAMVGSFYR